jgi:hypothetical protein
MTGALVAEQEKSGRRRPDEEVGNLHRPIATSRVRCPVVYHTAPSMAFMIRPCTYAADAEGW